MRRLLAWLLTFWPDDPNLDGRDDWQSGSVTFKDCAIKMPDGSLAEIRNGVYHPDGTVTEPACILCPRPALQDGLCGEHGGLPWHVWPGDKQARLTADIEEQP